jgi:septum site-determining protein MinC
VGISGGDEAQNDLAATMELAVLSGGGVRPRPSAPRPERPPQAVPGRLVDQPVRSGQRIYAPGGDLIVTGPVSSGAELLADGSIHVYGALRGRALAGVKGEAGARVFCQALQAELVSVAGIYRVSEDIDEPLRGRAAQIYLHEDRLIVQAL